MQYKCSKCNMAVIVLAGKEPIKACTCEAPVIVEMVAQAKCVAGIKL